MVESDTMATEDVWFLCEPTVDAPPGAENRLLYFVPETTTYTQSPPLVGVLAFQTVFKLNRATPSSSGSDLDLGAD